MYATHEHSDYSNAGGYLDAINRIQDLVEINFKLGLKGAAITDHEILSGHVRFIKEVEKLRKLGREALEKDPTSEKAKRAAEFKWILGNEIYLTKEGQSKETHEKGDKFYHFILMAKDYKGWQQINELSSKAWSRYYKRGIPRKPTYVSDLEEVVGNDKGHIVATSACLGSYLGQAMFNGSDELAATGFINKMKDIFGEKDFFLEIQPGQSKEQIKYNKWLVKLSEETGTELIAATDAHYPRPEDKEVHAAYLSSQDAERETADFYDYTYLMSQQEMEELFATHLDEKVYKKAIANTDLVGESVELYNIFKDPIVPYIPYVDEDKWESVIHQYDHLENFKRFSNSNEKDDKFLIYQICRGIDYIDKKGWLEDERTTKEKLLDRIDIELEQIEAVSEKLNQNMSRYFTTFQGMTQKIWEKSIIAPGRGSAGAFAINFVLAITQINPLTQPMDFPYWRFLAADKASMPDIDIDVCSSKKQEVFKDLEEWLKSFNAVITNIATFGKEKPKSALITAARGLGYTAEDGLYFASMIPSDRGFLRPLEKCYYGDEEQGWKPVREFVEEMDLHPDLFKVALRIEGLINKRGVHAAGVAIFNDNKVYEQTATMVAPGGQTTTQFDLADAELVGVLKYDLLATDAVDGIQTELMLLVENGYVDWEGSLKATYDKILHPSVLEYDSPEMWQLVKDKRIISLFQFDSPVGEQAIEEGNPKSLLDMALLNAAMRLMAPEGREMPILQFKHQKENIQLWYSHMEQYGLTSEEIDILRSHLDTTYGMCITQEQLMILLQDERITNFPFLQTDKARKVIAKKKMDQIESLMQKYFDSGLANNRRKEFLQYIWDELFAVQLGYAFSIIHTIAYSIIAIQQMNLVYKYPEIFWATSRLMVESGSIDFLNEDLEILAIDSDDDEEGEDDSKSHTVNYFKMSSAIGKLRSFGIQIEPPNINESNFTFRPDVENNKIYFGIRGITRIGTDLIQEIIANRPYSSLSDFLNKVKVNKIQATMLIKAGAFDEFGSRKDLLKEYLSTQVSRKSRITLQNMQKLISYKLLDDSWKKETDLFRFNKHVKKFFKYGDLIVLEGKFIDYAVELGFGEILKYESDGSAVSAPLKEWEKTYKKNIEKIKPFLKSSEKELVELIYNYELNELIEKYDKGTLAEQEMEALSFYYTRHEFEQDEYKDWLVKQKVSNFFKLPEEPTIWFQNERFKMFDLYFIAGTSIGRDKQKHICGLLTKEGFVKVKFYRSQFIKYDKQIKIDGETEKSWFAKGSKLLLLGYRRGDYFIVKNYKSTSYSTPIFKIEGPNQLRAKRKEES